MEVMNITIMPSLMITRNNSSPSKPSSLILMTKQENTTLKLNQPKKEVFPQISN
jgi:hypothetical protein